LTVSCKPGDIPETVQVDVTQLNVGDFVKVSGVPAPAGAEILASNDFNVLTILGARGLAEEEEEEAPAAESEAAAESEEG
jgi:large subunit ribosomal protein L25